MESFINIFWESSEKTSGDDNTLITAVMNQRSNEVYELLQLGKSPHEKIDKLSLVDYCLENYLGFSRPDSPYHMMIASLIAYGAEPSAKYAYREFIQEYLDIQPSLRKAQQSRPNNLLELIKALLEAYLGQSIFTKFNDYGLLIWINEHPDCNFEQIKTKIYSLLHKSSNDSSFTSLANFILREEFKYFLSPVHPDQRDILNMGPKNSPGISKEKLLEIADNDSSEMVKQFIADCELPGFEFYWQLKKDEFIIKIVINGKIHLVDQLTMLDPDLLSTHRKGARASSLLHIAIEAKNDEMFALLIGKGCFVNSRGDNHYTLLHAGIHHSMINIVKLLLENGVNLDIKNLYNQKAMQMPTAQSSLEIFTALLHHGADISEIRPANNIPSLVKQYFTLRDLFEQAQQSCPATLIELVSTLLHAYINQPYWYQKQDEKFALEVIELINTSHDLDTIRKIFSYPQQQVTGIHCGKLTAIFNIMHDDQSRFFIMPSHLKPQKSSLKIINNSNCEKFASKSEHETSPEFTRRIRHDLRSLAHDSSSLAFINNFMYKQLKMIQIIENNQLIIPESEWTKNKNLLIHEAIKDNQIEIVKKLIASDKQWMYATSCGHTALEIAVSDLNKDMVTLLLENGAILEKIESFFNVKKNIIIESDMTNALEIYAKLIAYGANVDDDMKDHLHIAYFLARNYNKQNPFMIDLIAFKYHYLAIKHLLVQAQETSPLTLNDLIKALFIAYLNRPFYMTTAYKQQATIVLEAISNYTGNDLVGLLQKKILDYMKDELKNYKTFLEIYTDEATLCMYSFLISDEYLEKPYYWEREDRENTMLEIHELFHPPLEDHSDPFIALCEFILVRKNELAYFLKPMKFLYQEQKKQPAFFENWFKKAEEISLSKNNDDEIIIVSTNEESSSSWSIYSLFDPKIPVLTGQIADESSEDSNDLSL